VAHESQESLQHRRNAVGASLSDDIEALLVTGWENVRYLSGFTGSNGALLVTRSGEATLATDGRYVLQAADEAPDAQLLEAKQVGAALVERAATDGVRCLGIESAHVTLAQARGLRAAGGAALAVVETDGLVEQFRQVKDDEELNALRHACEITDLAFTTVVVNRIRPGVTEREVADLLYAAMRAEGAEAAAFDPVVAFGPNSAIPHHQPTDRELAAGDLVKTDFGARYAGYHADLTRTVVVGPAADWQRELHASVAETQQAGKAAAVPGASPVDLDAAARSAIEATGNRVMHALGHGVGLQIHEDPFLAVTSSAGPLVPGMAVTIEPGIYLAGKGGVRIEDTIVITGTGSESLTASSRELIEI
jgi:Xaa-Pro dipeptidase